MIFLIGFLCCLANAAQQEYGYVAPRMMLVPMGVMPQPMLYGGSVFFFPKICYQPVICGVPMRDAACADEGVPNAKRPHLQSEDSQEVSLNARGLSFSQEQSGFVKANVSEAAVMQEVVAQTDDEARVRRADILAYLRFFTGNFVPETKVQELHQQSADEVLEDVMALIAAKHKIEYENKHYRFCVDPIFPSISTQVLHTHLDSWVRSPQFQKYQSLSAVEQAYHIYAEKGVYVPVSAMAVWIEMQKERRRRGAGERKLERILHFANRTLRIKRLLEVRECERTNLGNMCSPDLSLIKRSLKLYAQGRKIVGNEEMYRRSGSQMTPDERFPEILQYLQNHNEQPVCESTLRGIMKHVDPGHMHRDLYRVIVTLRERSYNIIQTPSPQSHLRPGGQQWSFTLKDGKWSKNDGCYQKALWKILDKPSAKNADAKSLFLELSNEHYTPCFSVVEEIIRFKKFLAGEDQGEHPEKLRSLWEIVLHDRRVYRSMAYYAEKMHTQEDILKPLLRSVKRLWALYMLVDAEDKMSSEPSLEQR